MGKKFITLLFILAASITVRSVPTKIPPEIKQVVAFIYTKATNKQQEKPIGTGFLVGIQPEDNKEISYPYLVTAKHVITDSKTKKLLSEISIRLNKKAGGTETVVIPLINSGPQKNVFTHTDTSIDIAVIPFLPSQEVFEFKILGNELITDQEQFKSLKIGEGSDVFFTGLFASYTGENKNYPITRFGKVALIADEKINVDGIKTDLYLIECASYGGNSGSPVFFYLGPDREFGSLTVGPPQIVLAGVMKGAYQEQSPIQLAETSNIPVSISNIGIAAVVPSYKLKEILFNEELTKQRQKRTPTR